MTGGKYKGPPMDPGNMRRNRVHSLSVTCLDGQHGAVVNVDDHLGTSTCRLWVPATVQQMRQ